VALLPGEFELIERYFAPLARGFPGAYRLRDDAALIAPAPGHDLVAKSDVIVANVHFLPDDPPELVARKALRVNLSDLAAKGAIPRAYLLDLMLPRTLPERWIGAFARGLARDQKEYGVHLIGGDTDSTPGPVAVAITAFGEVPAGRMVLRSGARPGDTVFVTGTIGDGALGLQALCGALPGLDAKACSFLADRYRLPLPRMKLGARLLGRASAAIDISDGLVADLGHLCEASGLAAVVEGPRVPLSPAARAVLDTWPARMATVLTGGDDYEILFTAPAAAPREFEGQATAIGRMVAPEAKQERVTILDGSGRPLSFERGGWAHF
jgi:thiamine-monophosphate kinase